MRIAAMLLVAGLAVALIGGCLARPASHSHSTAGGVPPSGSTTEGGAAGSGPPGSGTPGSGAPGSGVPGSGAAFAGGGGGFNGTDAAWLQLMAAMDERIMPVLEVGARRGDSPGFRAFAERALHAHSAELRQVHVLLSRTGSSAESNPHRGHDMPGMPTAADLAALRRATGPEFGALFARLLRAHLDQRALLARSERSAGAHPEAKALAMAVEATGKRLEIALQQVVSRRDP